MCVCGTIYLAEHITNHMVTFPSERNLISEDLIFNIEYMQYACGACLLNDNSYYYRINPKSLSKRYLADRVVKYCSFYRYEVNRLTQLGYPHDVILRCSRQFFVNLRYAIKQENRQISKKPMKSSCNAIRDICFNDLVIKILNDYPIYKLGRKQKIFLMLIQKRACKVLYLLASFNII